MGVFLYKLAFHFEIILESQDSCKQDTRCLSVLTQVPWASLRGQDVACGA